MQKSFKKRPGIATFNINSIPFLFTTSFNFEVSEHLWSTNSSFFTQETSLEENFIFRSSLSLLCEKISLKSDLGPVAVNQNAV